MLYNITCVYVEKINSDSHLGKNPTNTVMVHVLDVDRLTYSASPHDSGVGEGSWSGLCFNPVQWSMVLAYIS